eukprot:12991890-Alexandrium_andersonii.AAC.1
MCIRDRSCSTRPTRRKSTFSASKRAGGRHQPSSRPSMFMSLRRPKTQQTLQAASFGSTPVCLLMGPRARPLSSQPTYSPGLPSTG